jgi:hypothetical protein
VRLLLDAGADKDAKANVRVRSHATSCLVMLEKKAKKK